MRTAMGMDDDVKHFLISGAAGAGSETILHYTSGMGPIERISAATFIGSLPGLVKEISDSRKEGNEFGLGDMGMDVLGSFSGALMSGMINDRIQVRLKAGRKSGFVTFVLVF